MKVYKKVMEAIKNAQANGYDLSGKCTTDIVLDMQRYDHALGCESYQDVFDAVLTAKTNGALGGLDFDYVVVSSYKKDEFKTEVVSKLEKGWKLQGGVNTQAVSDGAMSMGVKLYYFQAMVKEYGQETESTGD